jgi:chemosensory pili system protein ChpC
MSTEILGEELYSLLVPLNGQRLLLPRTCVAEVIGYNAPIAVEGAPEWFLGRVNWSGRNIPLVSFEGAMGDDVPDLLGRARIAILHAISGRLNPPAYGILTLGFPQLVKVNAKVLSTDQQGTFGADSPVICRVNMLNERPLIPDLDRLEKMVAEAQEEADYR